MNGENYPFGIDEQTREAAVAGLLEGHGTGATLLGTDAALWRDKEVRRWYGRYERLACDRFFIAGTWRLIGEIDLRAVLPLVRAETLVVSHRDGSLVIPAGSGAYMAEQMPAATYVELPGPGTLFCGDDRISDEIDAFLATAALAGAAEDRVLASVLFTDLADSTQTAARLGDRRWRDLLDRHDALSARLVDAFRGRLVKSTGDGILATFDGPARAVRCAQAICRDARRLGLEVRAGVHAGEIELRGADVGGIAVHVAARVMAKAEPGEVVVSRTIKDLTAGSGLQFDDRGSHELKGIAEPWQLYGAGGA
jgi:class 3 adenylate cyclase